MTIYRSARTGTRRPNAAGITLRRFSSRANAAELAAQEEHRLEFLMHMLRLPSSFMRTCRLAVFAVAVLAPTCALATTATSTTNFTTSSASAVTQITQNPPVNVQVDTYSTQLIALQGGPVLYDQSFNVAFSNSTFQSAVVSAEGILSSNGAVSFLRPTLKSSSQSLLGSSSNTVTAVTGTNVSTIATQYVGPQTIFVGDFGTCNSFALSLSGNLAAVSDGCTGPYSSFSLLSGQTDYDTLVLSSLTESQTTTTTNTVLINQIYQLEGVSPSAIPEPASLTLLGLGLGALVAARMRRRYRTLWLQTRSRLGASGGENMTIYGSGRILRNRRNSVRLALFACVALIASITVPSALRADTLAYGMTSGGIFGTVDLNTGIFTPISSNLVFVSGFAAYNGNLYGIDPNTGTLIQINPATGAITYAPTQYNVNTAAFGSSTAGLFMIQAGTQSNLYSINPTTGAATLIGPTGLSACGGCGVLSVSNDSSTLYWSFSSSTVGFDNFLYTINTTTGAATLVGSWIGGANAGGPDLGDEQAIALLFEGGTLWAEFGNNTGPTIGTLNTTTAAPTVLEAEQETNGAGQEFVGLAPDPLSVALQFVSIAPCRVADTRNAAGPFGGPLITGGTSRNFTLPNSTCGIPATAQAYSLNVTAVPNGPLGYLTVWPAGQSQPVASLLNSLDGRVKAGAATVPAGTNGAISIFASNDTNVVLDIDGYFVPAATSTALAFHPLTPCRIADTRTATGPLGGPFMTAGQDRTFPVLSSSCNVPSSAQAYSLNFTAVPHTLLGYLTTWPTGQTQPLVSTLNAPTGAVTANAAIVPAGSNGAIDVFVTNDTDVVIDINGYYAPPGSGGLSLYNVQPCRVLDTRNPQGSQPSSGTINVSVAASACAVPSTAQAYVFNATVVPSGALGYLTLWPQGASQPAVSTLNSLDGTIVSNMAIVPTTNGLINAFLSNPTYLILDISGYFAP